VFSFILRGTTLECHSLLIYQIERERERIHIFEELGSKFSSLKIDEFYTINY